MWSPVNDGVDHINIYTKGATPLGRMLTNLHDCEFTVPGYGSFQSLEGFWYYFLTGSQHPEFLTAKGFGAKKMGKVKRDDRIDKEGLTEEQKSVILEAIRCKLRQNKQILIALAKSELPFAHYYYYGSADNAKVIELPQYDWMIEEFDRLRKLLKETNYGVR
ncbi:hypothetical protein Hena1_00810 [Erwinia phage Hena1]|uniref:Uncharacterized protein n=1 Tax=Erwinia phage Hena1 TaxID=2678601 RepID=A0A6B9JI84_9CAUD|nr:hypothetical protein HWC84_gp080 [Erwinia phage Hena1]QGZ16257.1 hypothetical protein Hena1_00810 [Erwinia phage Hena1]